MDREAVLAELRRERNRQRKKNKKQEAACVRMNGDAVHLPSSEFQHGGDWETLDPQPLL